MPKTKPIKLSWHTEQRRVCDLVPHPKNPRVMDESQAGSLDRSINTLGFIEIPVIDTNNRLLAGHKRTESMIRLGRKNETIDVRVPNRPLTEKEADQYLLISNAVHGSFDFSILRTFPQDILLNIGFNMDDLNSIFDAMEIEDDHWETEKEVKKIGKPTVKPNQLYALGGHRLLVGDACDEAAVRRLVGNEKIDLVDVDPPYNISLKYEGTKGQYGGAYKDNKSDKDYRAFLSSLIKNALGVCKENAHLFFWADQRNIGVVQELYREYGIDTKRVLIWAKGGDNPTPQIAWNKSYEPLIYGTVGRPYLAPNVTQFNEFMNRDFGNGARLLEDIGDLFDIQLVRRLAGQDYTHPAEKPPSLGQKPLKRCSRPGDNVLDLCGGSGSLLIACEQMKRRAFIAEVDLVFATLIIKRYEKLTSIKAKLIN